MSTSSTSTTSNTDLVSIILEINQLLFQQTLLLSEKNDQEPAKSGASDLKRSECCQRLSANLSFLAACAEPKSRRNAKLPPLVPPKGVESVKELYTALATAVSARKSPKPAKLSPNHVTAQALPSKLLNHYSPHPAAQVRASHSPSNGMMSPPTVMPAQQLYQQQVQQAQLHQQQRQQQQQQQLQHQRPPQVLPHQQQQLQHSHYQQNSQQHIAQPVRTPVTNVGETIGLYQSPQPSQHAPPVGSPYINPYRQEQLRHLQMQSMPGYPQQVGMSSSPPPHSQQSIPSEYMQSPSPHQINMGRMSQQQIPQQIQYAAPLYQQQHPQGHMQTPYYPNGGQGYL